jgi:PRTRC genetic system ThiF family protein
MSEFDPHINPRLVVLVGLGGTGSQLARSVCRMIYDMERRGLRVPELLFVDPDVIEAKNVGRQMFTPADVGRFKAETLACRFNRALGLNISWRNEPLNHEWFARSASYYREEYAYGSSDIIWLGAVDNHEARGKIARLEGTWIDAGNHFASGQVVIGNTTKLEQVRIIQGKYPYLPSPALIFPQLLEPPAEPERSCAELIELGEQHLLVNDMVAGVAAQYLYKLLHRQPITSFITYVDLDGLIMRSVPITEADLNSYVGVAA